MTQPITWLQEGQAFPPVAKAWGEKSPASGLLAAGTDLSVATLKNAYSKGIFPWYNDGQPILWWSPDPRMVLRVEHFKLHRSLRKTLQEFLSDSNCCIRIDSDFHSVIKACAAPRTPDGGTWILPEMQAAYLALHKEGFAHSVETWIDGRLAGGLYCTAMGAAVFGESMFTKQSNASKIALAALVALCRAQGVAMIDCQQNTAHLASLGAAPMKRESFCQHIESASQKPELVWQFEPLYWQQLDARLV